MSIQSLVPIRLGFTLGGLELHFSAPEETLAPASNPCAVHVRTSDIAGLSAPLGVPAEDMPWGMREFCVHDPDGALLRFGQDTKPASA